jgi:hypothetical protein
MPETTAEQSSAQSLVLKEKKDLEEKIFKAKASIVGWELRLKGVDAYLESIEANVDPLPISELSPTPATLDVNTQATAKRRGRRTPKQKTDAPLPKNLREQIELAVASKNDPTIDINVVEYIAVYTFPRNPRPITTLRRYKLWAILSLSEFLYMDDLTDKLYPLYGEGGTASKEPWKEDLSRLVAIGCAVKQKEGASYKYKRKVPGALPHGWDSRVAPPILTRKGIKGYKGVAMVLSNTVFDYKKLSEEEKRFLDKIYKDKLVSKKHVAVHIAKSINKSFSMKDFDTMYDQFDSQKECSGIVSTITLGGDVCYSIGLLRKPSFTSDADTDDKVGNTD